MQLVLRLLFVAAAAMAQQPSTTTPLTAAEQQRASIAQQKASIRVQAQNAGARLLPDTPIAPIDPPACDPMPDPEVSPLIEAAAKTEQVQPKLLRAVIEQESAYRPCAVSPKGAQGLMQLMPGMATDLGVRDPFDAKENIAAGAKYLKQLLDKYKGDLSQALGAYNAGPAAVDQASGVPAIQETRDYVKAILEKMGSLLPPTPVHN